MKALGIMAIFLTVCAPSVYPSLAPTNLDAFRRHVTCGAIASVVDVAVSPEPGPYGPESQFNADLRIEKRFGTKACDLPERLTYSFPLEVHATRVEPGMRAVVFLKRKGEDWVEAVYGRSVWPIVEINGSDQVEVGWRNDFLMPEYIPIIGPSPKPAVALGRIFPSSIDRSSR